MGDTFWMEDKVRVEWEEANLDFGGIFREPHKPAPIKKLSFLDSQFKEFIFQKAQYPITNTGSQYLDPVWRRNMGKIHPGLTKLEVLISLN